MADSENVLLAVTGAIRVAPVGTTAPTTAAASYAVGWVDLGYVSEDGIEEPNEADWTEIKAWQNGEIVRRLNTSSSTMFSFMIIETTAASVGLYYAGSDLVATGADDGPATLTIKGAASDPRAFGLDVIDGTRLIRTIIPRGEVTEREAITNKTDEVIGYGMTISAYPAADGTRAIRYYSALPGIEAP